MTRNAKFVRAEASGDRRIFTLDRRDFSATGSGEDTGS
jgi:hypothetical protein